MYLSKVLVSWQKARNPYEIHRVLWKMFPSRQDESRDFLFRIERQQKGLETEILMQSINKPVSSKQSYHVTALREYQLSLLNGQKLRFRLRANPVKTISDKRGRINRKGKIKKCRVPLIREEDQRAWLQRKFSPFCSIVKLNIQNEAPLYFRKKKEQRTGKIQTVLFNGIIMINDPDSFLDKMTIGIGPAKAFGCGMLSIAPYTYIRKLA